MKLAVILGTVRTGRHSEKIAKWVTTEASRIDGVEAELVDLKDFPLPFFEESSSPQFTPDRKAAPDVQKWLDKVAEFEAYVIVTPEYNHSIPGVLKNAFDHLDYQVKRKPFAIVSHGTVGGARAAEHLKAIIFRSLGIVVPSAVALLMNVAQAFDENGTLPEEIANQPYGAKSSIDATLNELKWFADTLTPARNKS